MKRPLLILVGFIGALASILGITPPQFGQSPLLKPTTPLGNGNQATNAGTVVQPATKKIAVPTATPSIPSIQGSSDDGQEQDSEGIGFTGATSATTTVKANVTKKNATKNTTVSKVKASKTPTKVTTKTPTASKTPTPVATKPSGTFTGAAENIGYGIVQVRITVANGKITSANAIQQPQGGRSGQINQQAVPMLNQEALAAQSASIQGVGGASYTSQGYQASLASAIAKAGI